MGSTFSKNDSHYMAIALKLANEGRYGVGANPMVGCVIVKDDQIIAKGITKPSVKRTGKSTR